MTKILLKKFYVIFEYKKNKNSARHLITYTKKEYQKLRGFILFKIKKIQRVIYLVIK